MHQTKVFSWVDRFTVFDETGADKYYVEGNFSRGERSCVTDLTGPGNCIHPAEGVQHDASLLRVHGRRGTRGNRQAVYVFFEKYGIEGLDWTIEGDFWAHEYRITQNGREVVSISRSGSWGDCYALDIADSADETLALAVVLAIDAVHAQANAAAAST